MAGDFFKEQLVQKEFTRADAHQRTGIIILVIVLSVSCLVLFGAGGILFGAIFSFFGYRFIAKLNVEYEYIYTNGVLDIDIVYNKAKRKSLFTGNTKDIQVMAHVSDAQFFSAHSDAKEKDYSSGAVKENTYAFVTRYKDNAIKIIIEPEQEILDAMAKDLTSWKFHKRQG